MAAQAPPSSGSRRSRDTESGDMTIGNFRRLEEIGKGSFATVYKAAHVKDKSFAAIKSVQLHKLNPKLRSNLLTEIKILKTLHHPHIVALIDCIQTTHHIHLVMEFCQLGDLSVFIKKREKLGAHPSTADMVRKYPNAPGGGLNEVVVRHFLKQLCSALEFLRSKNFIHRDLKPQNLLINPSPVYYAKARPEVLPYTPSSNSLIPVVGVESLPMLKIADFGFARALPETSLAETLCGSPLYMAPEILRYEKYDAKADLWSVGTVTYEMITAKAPFKAMNHVDLLRTIEQCNDKISFPDHVKISKDIQKVMRGLLKRAPVERMGFQELFDSPVLKDDIPGLVDEDRSRVSQPPAQESMPTSDPPTLNRRQTSFSGDARALGTDIEGRGNEAGRYSHSPRDRARVDTPTSGNTRPEIRPTASRQATGAPSRPSSGTRRLSGQYSNIPSPIREHREEVQQPRRPAIMTHATAPSRNDFYQDRTPVAAAAAMERQSSRNSSSPGSSLLKEKPQDRTLIHNQGPKRLTKEEQERVAQEVAFERDYVVVEKRAVEVNAFADELAANSRRNAPASPHHGAMVRRATTQGAPNSATGAQVTPSRAMQIATGKQRPEPTHQRKSSYDRRYGPSPTSATSAISKALNMANFRLFGMGVSPPLGRGGVSPPHGYGAFPAYPTNQGSLVLIGDGSKTPAPLDEDNKAILIIEESATRSDVVFGFAEVKYKQLAPLAPSPEHGLGLHHAGVVEKSLEDTPAVNDDGLTVDAIITLSEEALVLYVKALSLLARSMDIAGAWWARKNQGEVTGDSSPPRSDSNGKPSAAVSAKVNNVVQWVRNRFNEVLEKAEFVRLKLIEAQRRLPASHPSHPSNHPSASESTPGMGTSAEDVIVSPGVTAEKLMYDRALEMSKSAAINELVGEDLKGCDLSYTTAIRMLEAVLESDEELVIKTDNSAEKEAKDIDINEAEINGVGIESRKAVVKLVAGIRTRQIALRKKIDLRSKRASLQPTLAVKPVVITAGTTAIATTPPR
ncbi:MAG: Serine/threonine-protein kinase [Candelina submexicana]|nr:MAG: Serine/threonine-protein kinase [Candelina submexicana]